ncbi:bifunctional serine/threonine-protein kinase/formylglycine-generating enzyme family protein [Microbulbifer rhizosphaerae]|uniref:Serine/threonine protein kinase n=1 Tax=Microbulbifer rhizosphaerae TaxID=1562603 RepID=A0A7W4WC19_9GAMM|nr:bifunctional serine/threonine-protein kinase/formylglycine-generating enzyme family protein [Microbulbifer rhizosphaerae]MBB3060937.1 serine/threonine protein kinase [Microbulbifer rhizosphaerae]
MNDKTRIAKPVDKTRDDGDTTVFVGRDNTGANDHPPVGSNPGLIPSAAADFTADATVLKPDPRDPDTTRIATPAREAVFFEPSSSRVGAVTKTVIKGRFELDKLLGVGGMGAVYKALDRRKVEASDSEPYVAIKLLNDDFRQHPDAFISLQREARKSQTLAHPNIVTVYDFDREGERVFMTMEFLEGAPLDKLLREHAGVGLEFELACSVLKDISQALIYAHSHSIVHSDFKPGNIFVTEKKGAKVFDFGIARAVSEGSIASKAGEKTLFDASTLGALTPAYASMEMLQGGEPAPSDDVYALGCVAYELFSGRHPFGKTPADKAWEQKLKPERIKSLNRRQWRALESALALKRQDRTATVEEFVQRFYVNSTWKWLLGGAFAALLVGAGVAYNQLERENVAEQQRVKIELEQQLQKELKERRIADKRQTIGRLIDLSTLTPSWEEDLQVELDEYAQLNPEDENYLDTSRQQVYELFVAAATGQLNLGNLDQADAMLTSAANWYGESGETAAIKSQLEQEREELRARLEAERLAAEREAERLRQQELAEERRRAEQEKQRQLNAILGEMEDSLRCRFDMNIGGVSPQLTALAQLDAAKALKIRPVLAEELNGCIKGLAAEDPLRTEPLLQQARALLPEQQLLQDFKLDYCGHLQPGSGGRGDRYTCADRLENGSKGPTMVVVNGDTRKALVVSKYEISNADFKHFCSATSHCEGLELGPDTLPVNNVSIAQAEEYLDWLSAQTGYDYRLPNEREWFAAASGNGNPEAADRNCFLKYGGIEKGTELLAARAGTGNAFGIVNAVGNVQEWVFGPEGKLMAAGGSRDDAMSRCLVTTKRFHSGEADGLTGFRIVRNFE